MEYLAEIAKQGLLGLFLALSLLANYFLYRENRTLSKEQVDLSEKRIQDIIGMKDTYQVSLDAMREAYTQNTEKMNGVINNVLIVVQNLQQLVQSRK